MSYTPFELYLKTGKVKKVKPDISEAKGLMKNALEGLESAQEIKVKEKTSSTIYKLIYDSIRLALQAFLSLDGYDPHSHEAIIAYGEDKDLIAEKEASRIDKARKLRNDINYRGKRANVEEVKGLKRLAEELIPKLREKLGERA